MQDYNTIIGAIQMRLNKCPTRSVMDRFRIGSSTLNLIMSRYKALELTIDELEAMSPKEVENLFYPQKNLQRKEVPLPDCNLLEYLTQRDIQTKNSGVNVRYRGKHRFFKGFNEFIKEKTRRCDNDFEKIERHVFF